MLTNEKILIIGGTGSLGNAIVKYMPDNTFVVFSRDEEKQWRMKCIYPHITYVIGSANDNDAIEKCILLYKPTIIIIAHALKHVDLCEYDVFQCFNINIKSIENILNVIIRNTYILKDFLKNIVFISTDKACHPINSYGMSKALAERLIVDASKYLNDYDIKCINVRYGNVINSRGSILPILKEQIRNGHKEITITNENMTRFFMYLRESIQLIYTAIKYGKAGETFIPRIKSARIMDLFTILSQKYNVSVKNIGMRAGEKIHEVLVNENELSRTTIFTDGNKIYYVIHPYNKHGKMHDEIKNEYKSSNNVLSIDELKVYLGSELELQ